MNFQFCNFLKHHFLNMQWSDRAESSPKFVMVKEGSTRVIMLFVSPTPPPGIRRWGMFGLAEPSLGYWCQNFWHSGIRTSNNCIQVSHTNHWTIRVKSCHALRCWIAKVELVEFKVSSLTHKLSRLVKFIKAVYRQTFHHWFWCSSQWAMK